MDQNKKRFPDLVVWSEERGFYPRELTYGSDLGAPVIKLENVDGWRLSKVKDVNNEFKSRYDELLKQAEQLKEEYEWNEILYEKTQYNFQPIVGHIYHLYSREDNSLFLSIIEPNSWNKKHIGSFRLQSNNKWIKL